MRLATFSADGGVEIRSVTRDDGFQIVLFDLDGNGKSDASIRVSSANALTADDFFFVGREPAPGVDAFTVQHGFLEALHPHDLTAMV